MDEKDYLDLCYRFYRDERDEVDSMLTRVGFTVSGLVLIGGAAMSLVEIGWVRSPVAEFAVTASFMFAFLTIIGVTLGVGLLAAAVLPRSYIIPPNLSEIDKHRVDSFAWAAENLKDLPKEAQETQAWGNAAQAMRQHLVNSATSYRQTNKRRKTLHNWATRVMLTDQGSAVDCGGAGNAYFHFQRGLSNETGMHIGRITDSPQWSAWEFSAISFSSPGTYWYSATIWPVRPPPLGPRRAAAPLGHLGAAAGDDQRVPEVRLLARRAGGRSGMP